MLVRNMFHDSSLLAGFQNAWQLVQHGSPAHIRLYLSNLKIARSVCLHLSGELDTLIARAEEKLKEHSDLEQSIGDYEETLRLKAS